MTSEAMLETTVVVIGAGITGLGAAYYLGANGIPYLMLEANDDVGGIWHTQRWHGARCDSDFVKYSYSFKPFPSSRCLLDRAEIQSYLRSVAEDFGMLEHIRFNTRVTAASFDSTTGHWLVQTPHGSIRARFLINGNGYFDLPHVPKFPGADTFGGEIIHTFDLDSERRFADKHVVLVGSGSTAICAAPELARVSESMTMLQRSPSYIYEIENKATLLMRLCQTLYGYGLKFPMKFLRTYLQARDDVIFLAFRGFPRPARWFFRKHWEKTVSSDQLQQDFSPSYSPWEQRIPVAIGLKDAVRRGEVQIKTGSIKHFTPTSVVLDDGEELPCDVCVLATGFELEFLKFDMRVDGNKIEQAGINFYKGVMWGGVPNYFQPVGVWHSAWTQRSETVTRYAVKIIKHMETHQLDTVSIAREEVSYWPHITPNYLVRDLPRLPRLYASYEMPTIDNLLGRYRFAPKKLNFT